MLKTATLIMEGKPVGHSVQYMKRMDETFTTCDTDNEAVLTDPQSLIRFYEQHCIERTRKAATKMQEIITEKGINPKRAWNEYAGLELVEVGVAYGFQWMVSNYFNAIEQRCNDPALKKVLVKLFTLYAV